MRSRSVLSLVRRQLQHKQKEMLNLMVERHNKGQSGNAETAPSSKKKTRRIPQKLVQVRLEALCQQAVLMILTKTFTEN